jgi:hypothetical protein
LPPFAGELWVYAGAEPGLLLAPLQPFGEQHLTDPAALHADALLAQVGDQAVQRPGGERQIEISRAAQGSGDDRTALLRRVGRRAPRAHVLLQPAHATRVEALEPEADRGTAQVHAGRDLRRAQAIDGVLHDLGTAHEPRTERARARHVRQLSRLALVQGAHPNGHQHALRKPAANQNASHQQKSQGTYRMHH